MFRSNGKVDVQISANSMSNMGNTPVEVRVVDRASRTTIVEFECSHEQFLRAICGTYLGGIEAWITPEHLRARLGKKLVVGSVKVPREVLDKAPKRHSGKDKENAIMLHEAYLRNWAKNEGHLEGWEDVRIDYHNHGTSVFLSRFEEIVSTDDNKET